MRPAADVASTGRLAYADRLRLMAIVAVASLHASAVRVVTLPDVNSVAWLVANAIDSACRWAVPAFVMLSGALLLDRGGRDSVAVFFRRRGSRVVVPLVFWAAFYFWWTAYWEGAPVTRETISRSLWQGLTENHLYYLFIIIGLYAVIPLLWFLVARIGPLTEAVCVVLLFWWASSGALFSVVPMNAFTRFIPYIPYLMAGHLLRSTTPPRWAVVALWVTLIAASIAITYSTHQAVAQYGRDDGRAFAAYDHFSPSVIAQAMCVFIVVQQLRVGTRSPKPAATVRRLSGAVFGVYLMHLAVLEVFRGITAPLPVAAAPMTIAIVVEVAGALTVSTVLTLILLEIPVARLVVGG